MKRYFYILLLTVWNNTSQAMELPTLVLKPEIVLKHTQTFLIKEKAIDIKNYQLFSIVFNYYSQYGAASGKWILFYSCKPIKGIHVTDCGFSVQVSNTSAPTFEFIKTDA